MTKRIATIMAIAVFVIAAYALALEINVYPVREEGVRIISTPNNTSSGTLGHDSLFGLTKDDHPQYLFTDGTRDLTGDWVVSANDVTLTAGAFQSEVLTVDTNAVFGANDANYAEFETDGTLVFNGDATVWEDLRIPVSSIRLGGASSPTATAYKGGLILAFGTAVSDTIYFNAQMPHSWKEGSDIEPHLHWAIPTVGGGGGAENVKWDFTYSWANIDANFPAESTDTVTIDVQDDSADQHMYDDISLITATGKTFSSMLICSLTRDIGVANDYTDDAYLLEVDFHYEIDAVGSRAEDAK